MARRVKEFFRELPTELRDILAETKNMSSSEALEFLRHKKAQSLLTYSEFRELLQSFSRKHKIPVRISSRAFERYEEEGADAFAAAPHGRYMIYVHPVLRYYSPNHISEVLLHELDHIKVMKRYGQITE